MKREVTQILEDALLMSYMRIEAQSESIRALDDLSLNFPLFTNHQLVQAVRKKLYFNIVQKPPPNISSSYNGSMKEHGKKKEELYLQSICMKTSSYKSI